MNSYDVVIVGAGPAGLRAAEVLKNSDLNVLLIEKKDVIGQKICAGGFTRNSLEIMDVPEYLFERKIKKSLLKSTKREQRGEFPEPIVYMIDRKEFGQWQLSKIKDAKNIEIRTSSKVTEINDNYIVVGNEKIGYKYLIGADGAYSVVRKHLKLPVKKVLASLQYRVPADDKYDLERLQIIMNSKYFHNGYAWVFPHKNDVVIGCAADNKMFPVKKLKQGFKLWLKENNIDVSKGKYESLPISYDYRGYKFGNIFLVGEAAGMASGLTGEGIYQALVSGTEVANLIINPDYKPEGIEKVLKYNRIQNKVLKALHYTGPLRNPVFNMLVNYVSKKGRNKNLTNHFSKEDAA